MSQTLVLKDVPEAEVENVTKKYRMMGAKIEITTQSDGKFTIRLTVEPSKDAVGGR